MTKLKESLHRVYS